MSAFAVMLISPEVEKYIHEYRDQRLQSQGVWAEDTVECILHAMEHRSPDYLDQKKFAEYIRLVATGMEYLKDHPDEGLECLLRDRVEADAQDYVNSKNAEWKEWTIHSLDVMIALELVQSEILLKQLNT